MNQLTTSLWGDESFTTVAVRENFLRMLQIVAKDTAPPLYYICLFIWTRIFGDSEVAIRSLSVLLFLGTVAIVYLIAKTVWNKKTGLLAALLTLANPFLFTFAFEGRMYAILVFTVTLSFYFFITNNSPGYILSATAAIYSHHYAILVLMFQFFWRLFTNMKDWWKTLKIYFAIGLLYSPWLYPLYKQVTMVSGQGFWLGKPQIQDIVGLLLKYIIGDPRFNWQKYLLVLTGLILILKQWKNQLKYNLLLLGWSIVPIIIAFLISLGKTSIFYDRYLIFTIPSILLLLAGGWRKISFIFIFAFVIPLLWVNYDYFTHPTKSPFRQLAAYVKNEAKSDDFLINFNSSVHHLWESKYYGLEAPLYNPGGDLPYYIGTAQMTEKDIIKKLPKKDRIGVIGSENPPLMEISNYHLLNYKQFGLLYFSWFIPNEKN